MTLMGELVQGLGPVRMVLGWALTMVALVMWLVLRREVVVLVPVQLQMVVHALIMRAA